MKEAEQTGREAEKEVEMRMAEREEESCTGTSITVSLIPDHEAPSGRLLPVSVNSLPTGSGGVPGGGVPTGLGVQLAETSGRAAAAGRGRAGGEGGEEGSRSQRNSGSGGETG